MKKPALGTDKTHGKSRLINRAAVRGEEGWRDSAVSAYVSLQ